MHARCALRRLARDRIGKSLFIENTRIGIKGLERWLAELKCSHAKEAVLVRLGTDRPLLDGVSPVLAATENSRGSCQLVTREEEQGTR